MNKIFDIRSDEISLTEGYWSSVECNEAAKLLYQWQILEESAVLDNFRICIKEKRGSFSGRSDSDAKLYKWIEAVSLQLHLATRLPENQIPKTIFPLLKEKLNEAINLITRAQTSEGYLFTYYQLVATPRHYFSNLLLEKELYCLGCLIESAISHFQSTQEQTLIRCAYKAAELLERELVLPKRIYPGDPTIEYALIRLYDLSGDPKHLKLAMEMIHQRNDDKNFRKRLRRAQFAHRWFQCTHRLNRKENSRKTKEKQQTALIASRKQKKSIKSGEAHLINSYLRKNALPFGNALRYLHFRTAEVALLVRAKQSPIELPKAMQEREPVLLQELDTLIRYHLYPNGVLGDWQEIQGFHPMMAGDSKTIYGDSSTAALLVVLLRELFELTENPLYPEVIEWLFSNALSAAFNESGSLYFYRQPLSWNPKNTYSSWQPGDSFFSDINIQLANLPQLLYKEKENELYLLQFISNRINIERTGTMITVESDLPEKNSVEIIIKNQTLKKYRLHIRIPAWAEGIEIYINGIKNDQPEIIMPSIVQEWEPHFYNAHFLTLTMDEKQETKSVKLLFANTIRTIEERASSNLLTAKTVRASDRKAFFRNSFLFYYDSVLNPHIGTKPFTINLSEPIETIEKEGELFIQLTTTSMEKILLTCWKNQSRHLHSHKEIWLPCKGGLGEWDYSPFD